MGVQLLCDGIKVSTGD